MEREETRESDYESLRRDRGGGGRGSKERKKARESISYQRLY